MLATRSSEMSVYNKPTQRHIPQDSIFHSHRRQNLKSYESKEDYVNLIGFKIFQKQSLSIPP
jgi:hypothetical protein